MAAPQTYKNHARFDPLYHFFLAPLTLLNVIAVFIWHWHHHATSPHMGPWAVLMSLALVVLVTKMRLYPLKVQDRVIRLEEKLRLASLCPAEEMVELESLTIPQYVGLRFASNAELPELARRAVREKLSQKQIKEAIRSWRPDEERV